jgi:hypothetical protein
MMKTRNDRRPKLAKLKGKCSSGKIRFRDRAEALATLHHFQSQTVVNLDDYDKGGRRKETRAYKCPECSGAHLTKRKYWIENKKEAA